MIDSQTFRIRIGCYGQKIVDLKSSLSRKQTYRNKKSNSLIAKFALLLLLSSVLSSMLAVINRRKISHRSLQVFIPVQERGFRINLMLFSSAEVVDHNFFARYLNGNIQKQKGIINMHLNIRSLRNKVIEVKHLVKEHSPHIFGISEAELWKDKINEIELKVPGYNILFPKSWSKYGYARILVYVKKTFNCVQVEDLQNDSVQSIWLKGGFRNSKNIFFCHAYREHLSRESSTVQQDYLLSFLNQWESATYYGGTTEPHEVHISADMNIDVNNGRWLQPDYPLLTLSRLIKNVCHVSNFHQLVNDITRVQYNGAARTMESSCLDHIYTNAKFRCSAPNVIPFGNSDHDLLKYIRYSKISTPSARVICKRSYKSFDRVAFLHDISLVDWYDVYRCTDVDSATEIFTNKFKFILDSHAPWVRFQERKNYTPWLTEETRNIMKERDQWKLTAKNLAALPNCQAQQQAWDKYKKLRNSVNNRKRYEENLYKAEQISEVADCPATLWKTAKSFMGWKSQNSPQQIKVNDTLLTSPRKIAQCMNEYFINKVVTIRSNMTNAPVPLVKLKELMQGKNCRMQLKHVSLSKVKRILKSLSNSRSTGIDELDNFSIKLAADFVVHPIHHIVCLSIIQSKFPESWKSSKVLPLHKKGERLDRKNYRPVSILSPVSKVLEKVIYEQIYSYFTRNSIFHPNLHGYRSNRSTQTALLQMYDRWVRASNDGQLSGVVLLDLSAAFDLVDPDLLLEKLKWYKFDDDTIAWVRSYMSYRQQAVWIDCCLSSFLDCPVGVPQGSNLGPLLFLIFYNDLPLIVNHCSIDAYADDSTMTVSAKSVADIGTHLTEDCKLVADWMVGNRLQLNADKTHLLTVGTEARLRIQNDQVSVHMGGIDLKRCEDSELLLGCHIEPHLKWHKHVDYLLGKLQTRIHVLEKLGSTVPMNIRKKMVEGLFNSILIYCLPVFGGCGKGDLDALQVVQNKAVRLVTQSGIRTSRQELFSEVDWLTVRQLICYHSALCTFRILKFKEPEYLYSFMSRKNRSNRIIVPHSTLTLMRNSYCYRGSVEWNILPDNIRSCQSIRSFKTLLKKWIQQNIPKFEEKH